MKMIIIRGCLAKWLKSISNQMEFSSIKVDDYYRSRGEKLSGESLGVSRNGFAEGSQAAEDFYSFFGRVDPRGLLNKNAQKAKEEAITRQYLNAVSIPNRF